MCISSSSCKESLISLISLSIAEISIRSSVGLCDDFRFRLVAVFELLSTGCGVDGCDISDDSVLAKLMGVEGVVGTGKVQFVLEASGLSMLDIDTCFFV